LYAAVVEGVSPVAIPSNVAGANIPTTSCGCGANDVAIAPDGQVAYAANADGTVTPISTATDIAGAAIDSGASQALGIAITPDGSKAVVLSDNFNTTITTIDLTTNPPTPGPPVSINSGPATNLEPWDIAISPDGKTAYAVGYTADVNQDSYIVPFDLTTSPPTPGTAIEVQSGGAADGIAITPNGQTAYVPEANGGGVNVVSLPSGAVTTFVSISGGQPTSVAITPNGATSWVTTYGGHQLVPISTATNTAGTGVSISGYPTDVAITPDGKTAYVDDFNNSRVTPVTLATKTKGAAISIGSYPIGLAITPDQAPVAALSVTTAPFGQATGFDASASTVALGTIKSYAWNFGDGHTATTTTPTTTHLYATAGTFNASVTETDSAGTSTRQTFTGKTVSNNGGPSAKAARAVTVAGTDTTATVALAANPNVVAKGGFVPLTATVHGDGATPTGTVTFFVNGSSVCTRTLTNAGTAVCTITTSATGSYQATATYSGDATYAPAGPSAPVTYTVTGTVAPRVTAQGGPGQVGQPFTVTATASGTSGIPTGTVTFTTAGVPLACTGGSAIVPLTGGTGHATASCTFTPSASGTLSVVTAYSGDGTYRPVSPVTSVTVAGS
jgi:DNA-binding beta-propeller fold protein YncE